MTLHLLENLGRIGFGAASLGNLGRTISDGDAAAALQTALDVGITYFDTAPFYGQGLSERRVGDVLRGRHGVILSTKVGRLLTPVAAGGIGGLRDGFASPMPFEAIYDYSYGGIMRSHEASLHRLGLSRINIHFVHDLGARTHGANHNRHMAAFLDGGYRALDELRTAGEIDAFGLGVNEWEICEQVLPYGRFDVFMLAGRYTLLDQSALDRLFPALYDHGAKVIAAGVYNSGILASGSAGDPQFDYAPAPTALVERVRAFEAVCGKHGVTLPAVALQFALANPLVVSCVPGLASARRVHETIALADVAIPSAFWRELHVEGLLREDAPVPA